MLIKHFFSILFLLCSVYSDISIDSRNRILLLDSEERIIEDVKGVFQLSLDSLFAPVSISSSSFSVWVTSASEFKSQKYSLRGEFLGEVGIGGKDIDADAEGVLIAGEETYLIQVISGTKIRLTWKEMDRCALFKDSLYLYRDDTLFVYSRAGDFIKSKFIPGLKDISVYEDKLCFLFKDSLVLSDTLLLISNGERVDGGNKFLSVLTDSEVLYYPGRKEIKN